MELERLEIIFDADTSGIRCAADEVQNRMQGIRGRFRSGFRGARQDVSNEMASMKSSIGNSMSSIKGLVAKGLAGIGVAKLGNAMINLASDLQETQNVVDVAFGEMAHKAEAFAQSSIKSFGMSEESAKRVSSTHMAMAKGMEVPISRAADMSLAITALSADMASFFNTTTDVTDTALRSIWTGETETLKKYGVVMTQANLQAFALKQGIQGNIAEMDQASLASLRYAYVMETLSYVQGDFARNSDSWANQTRVLSEQFKQLGAIIGGWFIHALTPVVQVINTIIGRVITLAQALNQLFSQKFGWGEVSTGPMPQTPSASAPSQGSALPSPALSKAAQKASDQAAKIREQNEKRIKQAAERTAASQARLAEQKKKHEERNAKLVEQAAKRQEQANKRLADAKTRHEEQNAKALARYEQQKKSIDERNAKAREAAIARGEKQKATAEKRQADAEKRAQKALDKQNSKLKKMDEQAKKTKGTLASFDQLNILNEPKTFDPADAMSDFEDPFAEIPDYMADLVDPLSELSKLEYPEPPELSEFEGSVENIKADLEAFEGSADTFTAELAEIEDYIPAYDQLDDILGNLGTYPMPDTSFDTGGVDALSDKVGGLFDRLKQGFDNARKWVSDHFGDIWQRFLDDARTNLDNTKAIFAQVWEDLKTLGPPLAHWFNNEFVDELRAWASLIATVINGVWDSFNIVFGSLWDGVIFPLLENLVTVWLPMLSEISAEVARTLEHLFIGFKSVFDRIWLEVVIPVLSFLTDRWIQFSKDLKDEWDANGTALFASIRDEISTLVAAAHTVIDQIKELGHPLAIWFDGSLVPLIQTLFSSIVTLFLGLYDSIKMVIGDIWNKAVFPLILNFTQTWLPMLTEIVDQAVQTFTTWFTEVKVIFDRIWQDAIAPAIELIVGIWTDFSTDLKAIWDKHGEPLFEAIREGIRNVGDIFMIFWTNYAKPVWDWLMQIIKKVWDETLRPFVREVIDGFLTMGRSALDFWNEHVAPVVKHLMETFKPTFDRVFEAVKNIVGGVVEAIQGQIDGLRRIFGGIVEFVSGVFSGDWSEAWEGIKNIFGGLYDYLKERISGLVNLFGGILGFITGPFKNIWSGGWTSIKNIFTGVYNFFSGRISGVIEIFRSLVSYVRGGFTTLWTGAWTKVKNFFGDIWDGIKNKVSGVWDTILKLFRNGGEIFSGVVDGISNVFKRIVNSLIKGINKVMATPFNAINGMLNKIRNVSILGAKPFSGFWDQNPLAVPQIPQLAVGTNYVAQSGLALIHEGEAVVPKKYNPALGGVANDREVGLLQEQNTILRQLLEKDSNVYLDDRDVTSKQTRNARRQQLALGRA